MASTWFRPTIRIQYLACIFVLVSVYLICKRRNKINNKKTDAFYIDAVVFVFVVVAALALALALASASVSVDAVVAKS